jgi:hypothetical protein
LVEEAEVVAERNEVASVVAETLKQH